MLLLNTDRGEAFEVAPATASPSSLIVACRALELTEVDALDASERAARGFGSSGYAAPR